mgnify:FL=1
MLLKKVYESCMECHNRNNGKKDRDGAWSETLDLLASDANTMLYHIGAYNECIDCDCKRSIIADDIVYKHLFFINQGKIPES